MATETRIGGGRYRMPSETTAGVTYNIQVNGDRGDCDCPGSGGAARAGHQCKHVRRAIAAERELPTMAEESTTAELVKREDVYAPMHLEVPSTVLPKMDEMKVMVTIANSVYKTSGKLIPSEIKTSEEAFAIMLAGYELGIPPMAAFREMYIVHGRTMPSARVLMGLVQNGDPGARFKWFERTPERAHVRLTRSNGQAIEVLYTWEDAVRADLPKKNRDGSPGVWHKFPADMLAYKAVTRACRLGGADLITGIGAAVRGAPTVMQAIEEDGDDEIPELVTVTDGHDVAPVDGRKTHAEITNVRDEVVELAVRLANEVDPDTRKACGDAIRERWPNAIGDNGKWTLGAVTDEECEQIAARIRESLGEVQGALV